MFKLAHLSDLHLGYFTTRKVNAQGINLREADGYITMQKIITDVINHEVDAVVVAGDTFHTPSPNMRSIQFAQRQFWRLWQAGIKVYILSGNHDVDDIKENISSARILNDDWKSIYSHAEPYVKHEISDGIHLHLVNHHAYADQSETMSKIKPVEGEINIFSTHGSVIDPILEYKLHTEHSPREIVIPDGLLDGHDWSYTLLGHIHERGWVGSSDKLTDTANTKIYYNGSSIRRGFSDKDVPLGRGWTLWEIDDNGQFTGIPKTVEQRPQYDFDIIDAAELTASEITDKIVENLKSSQTNGVEYDSRTAPILRQKIINLSPSKSAGLDRQIIDHNSQHAMDWKLRPYLKNDISNSSNSDVSENLSTTDVIDAYDEWAKSSTTLSSLSDDFKNKVFNDAKNFVKLGQESILEAEG